ncbi:MAG: hypothetical protein JNK28_02595 [Burkholderiaceae bacterium]|nr:hypothetical protein [Burkholderiaceae bacterium]
MSVVIGDVLEGKDVDQAQLGQTAICERQRGQGRDQRARAVAATTPSAPNNAALLSDGDASGLTERPEKDFFAVANCCQPLSDLEIHFP